MSLDIYSALQTIQIERSAKTFSRRMELIGRYGVTPKKKPTDIVLNVEKRLKEMIRREENFVLMLVQHRSIINKELK